MPKFLVRSNCEYTLVVDADDEDKAIAQANQVRMEEWDQAWSETEIDQEATEEIRELAKANAKAAALVKP